MQHTVRPALFWDFTQLRVVLSYQRFAKTDRSHLQGSSSLRRNYLTLEDGTERFSRNVCKKLPFCAA